MSYDESERGASDLVQLIPAADWWAYYDDGGRKPLVAWGLRRDGLTVALVSVGDEWASEVTDTYGFRYVAHTSELTSP